MAHHLTTTVPAKQAPAKTTVRARTAATPKRTGGRPTLDAAEQIRDRILAAASGLFFTIGYGATSMEAIAKAAGISKRTLYHRFTDKAEVMAAVVEGVLNQFRPQSYPMLEAPLDLPTALYELALVMVHAALAPTLLQLRRLMMAEASRFPELAQAVARAGGRQEAVDLIRGLLTRHAQGSITPANAKFAAEQFLQMTVSAPASRAMGVGEPMNETELRIWLRKTVSLFLGGFAGLQSPAKS